LRRARIGRPAGRNVVIFPRKRHDHAALTREKMFRKQTVGTVGDDRIRMMRIKKRWIKWIVEEADAFDTVLPWERGADRSAWHRHLERLTRKPAMPVRRSA